MWTTIIYMLCAHCQGQFTPAPWPATRAKHCSIRCTKAAYYQRNKAAVNAASKAWRLAHPEIRRRVQRAWNQSTRGKALKRAWFQLHYPRLYAQWRESGYLRVINARTQSRRVLLRHHPTKRCCCRGRHEGRIECHHRDGNPFNWAVTNLEWRCLRHHRQWHARHPAPPAPMPAALDSSRRHERT